MSISCHSQVRDAGYCLGQLRTALSELNESGPGFLRATRGPNSLNYALGRHGQCVILTEQGQKALTGLAHLTLSCPDNRHLLRTLTPDDLDMLRRHFGCNPNAQAILKGMETAQLKHGLLLALGILAVGSAFIVGTAWLLHKSLISHPVPTSPAKRSASTSSR